MTGTYTDLPDLADVYLEDSFVLEVRESSDSVALRLDLVLTQDHPRYRDPLPGEQYCYVPATLTFATASKIDWIDRSSAQFRDANGEVDMGNIDFFQVEEGAFHLGGDWGEVRIFSAAPPTLRIDQ
jgi:hypothetical protein